MAGEETSREEALLLQWSKNLLFNPTIHLATDFPIDGLEWAVLCDRPGPKRGLCRRQLVRIALLPRIAQPPPGEVIGWVINQVQGQRAHFNYQPIDRWRGQCNCGTEYDFKANLLAMAIFTKGLAAQDVSGRAKFLVEYRREERSTYVLWVSEVKSARKRFLAAPIPAGLALPEPVRVPDYLDPESDSYDFQRAKVEREARFSAILDSRRKLREESP